MFLHFRPRRCAHPKPPRTADDYFPDSAIIRLLIPASRDHTKRCPATTLPPPNALALRSALPSLPASSLFKALSARATPVVLRARIAKKASRDESHIAPEYTEEVARAYECSVVRYAASDL